MYRHSSLTCSIHALSQRLDDGYTLDDPLPGDRLIFSNGRTDTVTATNSNAVSMHIRRGQVHDRPVHARVKNNLRQKSQGERTIGALLEKYGITAEDFKPASAFVHTKFDGAWRPIVLKTEIESTLEDHDVRLKFSLPPGHYATTVCREYMKADPVQMI